MLAVNQINAQIKMSEMWNAVNDVEHPFNLQKSESGPNVRSLAAEVIPAQGQSNFICDGIKAWNLASVKIKSSKSCASAKF